MRKRGKEEKRKSGIWKMRATSNWGYGENWEMRGIRKLGKDGIGENWKIWNQGNREIRKLGN
jgi:hypothetical protein